jgi:hypothetical protein
VPKKQTTAAKKARTVQRAAGSKYTDALRDVDAHTDLNRLRATVAKHIFHSADDVLTADPDHIIRAAGASAAADRLHTALDDAGVDLSAELDQLADQAAAEEFGPFMIRNQAADTPGA